jgi:hypothetical protein
MSLKTIGRNLVEPSPITTNTPFRSRIKSCPFTSTVTTFFSNKLEDITMPWDPYSVCGCV